MKSLRIGLAAAAALATSLAIAPAALADGPQVTVDRATGLPAVAFVTVTATGFTPGEGVFVQQCAEVAAGVFGCHYENTESLEMDDQGDGATVVRVHRVFDGHTANGDLMGDLDCTTVELGCFVAVANAHGGAGAPIAFAG
jgi:hypothetical protein